MSDQANKSNTPSSSSSTTSAATGLPLSNDLSPKYCQALCSGLIKSCFYNDTTITTQYLQQQLFAQSTMNADSQLRMISTLRSLLLSSASSNSPPSHLSHVLSESGFTADQSAAVEQHWKKEQNKIQEKIIAATAFTTPKFSSLDWRVDLMSQSRHVADLNASSAIVQIKTKSTIPIQQAEGELKVVKEKQLEFEIDQKGVMHVLAEMNKLDEAIMATVQ